MALTSTVFPKEYQRVLKEIPESQLESFDHSYSITASGSHPYLRILESVERTILVYTAPSRYWTFLYGRLSFVTTQYEELLQYWNLDNNNEKIELAPFVARVMTFQNNYDDAIKICSDTIEKIDMDKDLKLIDILILFESYFTLGLAYSYTRQFEKAEDIINKLEELEAKYIVKKIVTEEYFLDLVYIEYIIKGYLSFFKGQPKEMNEALQTINSWIDKLLDPWLKGFYYNIYGISKLMFQELVLGEEALRIAFQEFETVHDMRGYTTVGANLGVSLITKGQRKEGREYLESVIKPQVKMKNYWLAVGNMLQVSKSYLDEKKYDDATKILYWAEEVAGKGNVIEPAIYSMFSYFFSRVGEVDKSSYYLDKLKEMTFNKDDAEKRDIGNYTRLFYYNASAVNYMAKGDLSQANQDILTGIEIADNTGYFNYALELSMIHLEIIFKRYIVDQKEFHLNKSLEVLTDLSPLIEMTENPYYETLFYIIVSYVLLGLNRTSEAEEFYDKAKELAREYEESAQYKELTLFEDRFNFIKRANPSKQIENPLFSEFIHNWLSDEYLSIFYVMEAMRLLSNLQFEKTNLGQQKTTEKLPQMLFIVGTSGITIFTYRFKESEGNLDEVLVGGFLSALTSFSQELFGGGMLSRIDQENHVLLMEKISEKNILVLIVDEETYLTRKKFKKFSSEIIRLSVVEYLDSDVVLTQYDPQFLILNSLIEKIFLDKDIDIPGIND